MAYPLFPSIEEVTLAYEKYGSRSEIYRFSYFGQMQTFRNIEEISALFNKLNWVIDIFSWQQPLKSNSFKYHKPEINENYYKNIVLSKYLIVFDNNDPYTHYMPSKLYQLIAFGKPIIVFGKNDWSATKDFLKNYPYYWYLDLRNSNIVSELERIVDNKNKSNLFNKSIYDKYSSLYSTDFIVQTISKDVD